MKMAEYMDIVLTRLGSPLLDIEIENEMNKQLEKILKAAFLELRQYIDTVYLQTLNYSSNGIDVSQYKVRAVHFVTRGSITLTNALENTGALLWSPLTSMMNQSINMGYTYSQHGFLQDYVATLQYKQLRNGLAQDLEYTFDAPNNKLYVFQLVPQAPSITMAYNKILGSIEEITDPYWVNLMIRLGLAYAKEVLGRIRSKYKPSSAPFELDGETLLSEARDELAEIRTILQENDNIFIPMN